MSEWLDEVPWNEQGLIPVVTQDAASGRVLTVAWMNREALAATEKGGEAVYWSRSRGKLWRKGEQSGNAQRIVEIRLDCDSDAVLLRVEQAGGIACHTGRRRCFFNLLEGAGAGKVWRATEPVLEEPGAFRK